MAQARRESELQEQAYLQRLVSAERGRDEALAALAQLKHEDVAVRRMERPDHEVFRRFGLVFKLFSWALRVFWWFWVGFWAFRRRNEGFLGGTAMFSGISWSMPNGALRW